LSASVGQQYIHSTGGSFGLQLGVGRISLAASFEMSGAMGKTVDDMALLEELTEDTLESNLRQRFVLQR
jgi:hypothetical protein